MTRRVPGLSRLVLAVIVDEAPASPESLSVRWGVRLTHVVDAVDWLRDEGLAAYDADGRVTPTVDGQLEAWLSHPRTSRASCAA